MGRDSFYCLHYDFCLSIRARRKMRGRKREGKTKNMNECIEGGGGGYIRVLYHISHIYIIYFIMHYIIYYIIYNLNMCDISFSSAEQFRSSSA